MRPGSIIIIFLFLFFIRMNAQNEQFKITYSPIGLFHTDYTQETGAPRQGILMPDGKGTIEIYPEYREALRSLELFKHIIVIYHLDKVKGWDNFVVPQGSDEEITYGLFATRTPRRPNPIGIATIRLEKIQSGILYVSGLDAFNGTPVLDIKPYLPSIDCVQQSDNKDIERGLGLKK